MSSSERRIPAGLSRVGSNPLETLRYTQGDMILFILEIRHSPIHRASESRTRPVRRVLSYLHAATRHLHQPATVGMIQGSPPFNSVSGFSRRDLVLRSGRTLVSPHLTKMFVTSAHFLFRKAARTGTLRPTLICVV